MKKSLPRLLHIRRLLEERAGHDLQLKTAQLRRLEAEAEKQHGLATKARDHALRGMLAQDAADSWLGLADAEILQAKKQRTEAMARAVSEEVAVSQESSRMRRMERQQVEALVLDLEEARARARVRREQHHLDDWFRNRPRSGWSDSE